MFWSWDIIILKTSIRFASNFRYALLLYHMIEIYHVIYIWIWLIFESWDWFSRNLKILTWDSKSLNLNFQIWLSIQLLAKSILLVNTIAVQRSQFKHPCIVNSNWKSWKAVVETEIQGYTPWILKFSCMTWSVNYLRLRYIFTFVACDNFQSLVTFIAPS